MNIDESKRLSRQESASPHIGIIPKVSLLKLFLDMVPSSSEDITCMMRGEPKRLSRNYLRRNGGKCVERSFYPF